MFFRNLLILVFVNLFLNFTPFISVTGFFGTLKNAQAVDNKRISRVMPLASKRKCRQGYKRHKSGRCVKIKCPKNQARAKNGHCYCKLGYKWGNKKRTYCVRRKCLKYQIRGSDQRCVCSKKARLSKNKKYCVLKKCPRGKKRDPKTEKCVYPPCPKKKIRPEGKSYCVYLKCPPGTVRDKKTKKCTPRNCGSKKRLAANKKYCVLKKCPRGKKRNSQTDKCEYPPCPEDKIRPEGKAYCVPRKCAWGMKRAKSGKCICKPGYKKSKKVPYCIPRKCGKKTYRASDLKCYSCPPGKYRPYARLTRCVPKKCPEGAERNKKDWTCKCPGKTRLSSDGKRCVPSGCPAGHVRNKKELCVCRRGYRKAKGKDYCVRKDCGKTHFRGKDQRCQKCPRGKYRPEGNSKCFWKPCPKGKRRGQDGKCHGRARCTDREKLSSDGTYCVKKICPSGTKRDAVTERCVFVNKDGKRCKSAHHVGRGGTCVPDECPRGKVRNSKGICYVKRCPSGYKKVKTRCVPQKCPPGTKRSKRWNSCINIKSYCPRGTFMNPWGKCIPVPCYKK
ncbi:MAG: hypothetical protein ACQES9_06465 [Myxococcota bacterium]